MTAILTGYGFQPTPQTGAAEGDSYPRKLWITLWTGAGKNGRAHVGRGQRRPGQ